MAQRQQQGVEAGRESASCWGLVYLAVVSWYFFGQRVEKQAVISANTTLMGKEEKRSACKASFQLVGWLYRCLYCLS